jgi:hypothetical protein
MRLWRIFCYNLAYTLREDGMSKAIGAAVWGSVLLGYVALIGHYEFFQIPG